jgi:hypothetical protein
MRHYFIEDDCGITKVQSYTHRASKNRYLKFINGDNKSHRGTVVDFGNGWTLIDRKGMEQVLSYSEVADLVAAFILWQSEGERIWEARIYGKKVSTVRAGRKRDERTK